MVFIIPKYLDFSVELFYLLYVLEKDGWIDR